jgi:hypothetical protein
VKKQKAAPPEPSESRRQHLQFLQAVIARMSSASGIAKGWALTIAIATFGYAGTKHSLTVALLGMFAVCVFAWMDARYLREERKYRILFDAARRDLVEINDMNAASYCDSLPKQARRAVSWRRIILSWSVRDYYGLILAVGVAIVVWISSRG